MEAIVEPVVAPNRYANGRIYKICSDLTEQVYIGSTCNPLSKRMVGHRTQYRAHLADKFHRLTSFDILQHPDAKIILVENFPCDSKEQLIARERHWIETTPNCVNKVVPGRTNLEYRHATREKKHEYNTNYYAATRDQQIEDAAEYYQANRERVLARLNEKHDCPCGGKFTTANKTKHLKTKKHTDWVAKNEVPAALPAAEVEA